MTRFFGLKPRSLIQKDPAGHQHHGCDGKPALVECDRRVGDHEGHRTKNRPQDQAAQTLQSELQFRPAPQRRPDHRGRGLHRQLQGREEHEKSPKNGQGLLRPRLVVGRLQHKPDHDDGLLHFQRVHPIPIPLRDLADQFSPPRRNPGSDGLLQDVDRPPKPKEGRRGHQKEGRSADVGGTHCSCRFE